MRRKKKIGLALGSGAARGLSQIGILTWLKEQGIEISQVSGCSIGSIIGALFAAGFTPGYMKDLVLDIGKIRILKYFTPSFTGSSFFGGQGISIFLKEVFAELQIEALPTPFACVAADLDSGEEVVFKEGNLVNAVLASVSIPGILPPVKLEGMQLVDGGLVNPVPLDLSFELGADLVIGVNVSKPVFAKRIFSEPAKPTVRQRVDSLVKAAIKKGPQPMAELLERIPLPGEKESEGSRGRMFYSIMADSLTVFSSRILSLKRINVGPHFLIEPPVGAYRSFDFDKAEELIEIGYREIESRKEALFRFLKRKREK